jgi:Helix-turn-helix
MSGFPPGVTILPTPPELGLAEDDDYRRFDWRYGQRRSALSAVQAAKAFPEPVEVGAPQEQMFGCSGSPDSSHYREATKLRAMREMGWEEARVALNRLVVPLRYDRGETSQYVALAEFALTSTGFTGFVGRKGEHAVKLRDALGDARNILHKRLNALLQEVEGNAAQLSRPITLHAGADMRGSDERFANAIVRAFWTVVPTPAGEWVRVIEATPDQAIAALDYLRATMAAWAERRPLAAGILDRLSGDKMPSAAEYAEAIHIADMLAFTSEKLVTLYAGIMHSMPIYRLYPTTPEPEAIALWWPWGRPAPLVDGTPPRPPKPRKQVLDPSLITATRPQDVVREVMQKTGINRTTAQNMTASMRKQMRWERRYQAESLLRQGLTKAEVARRVGLSPSRISALFKGEQFADSRRERELLSAIAEM